MGQIYGEIRGVFWEEMGVLGIRGEKTKKLETFCCIVLHFWRGNKRGREWE